MNHLHSKLSNFFLNGNHPLDRIVDCMILSLFDSDHSILQIVTYFFLSLREHHPDFEDGHQQRDFIYVKDVVDVMYWLMRHRKNSGIYNLGTGQSNTFLDLTHAVFEALENPRKISFIDTPEDIREKYQYFTEAKMSKLRSIGYEEPFCNLEEGVRDYVRNYLKSNEYY